MILKTYSSKNKIIFLSIIILAIIISLIYFNLQKYDYKYFIKKIENDYKLQIDKQGEFEINFFPKFDFSIKNLEVTHKSNNLLIKSRKINVNIIKEYLNWRNTKFYLYSPSIVINGIPLRETNIEGNLKGSKIVIKKIDGKINEGLFLLNIELINELSKKINVNGSFSNISLTTILNQAQQIDWKRLNIKLRSNNFNIKSEGKNFTEIVNNIEGYIPIEGLFYINATADEKFGVALLNILSKKIPELNEISKSVDFLFSRYADIPSRINGNIILNKGELTTEEFFIFNDEAKMKTEIIYNILNDEINGNLYFLNSDGEIIITSKLNGTLKDPQILIGGKNLLKNGDKEPFQDLKYIIENGITNIFQKLLETNN